LKIIKALILCTGVCLAALFLTMFLAAGKPDIWIMETDYYPNIYVTAPISPGDCHIGGTCYPYPYARGIKTYIDSANPNGYKMYVGCVYPAVDGTIRFNTVYGPGSGPTCASPQYAFWGNGDPYGHNIMLQGRVTYWVS